MRHPRLSAAILLALCGLPASAEEQEPEVEPPEDETFYGHLDKCARCERNPHNLCPVGAALLRRDATR